jgi:hypothetical protein
MSHLGEISLHLEENFFILFMSLDLHLILIGESNDGLVMRIMLLFLQDRQISLFLRERPGSRLGDDQLL